MYLRFPRSQRQYILLVTLLPNRKSCSDKYHLQLKHSTNENQKFYMKFCAHKKIFLPFRINTEPKVTTKNVPGMLDVSTSTKTSVKTNTITSTTSEYTILDVRLPLLNKVKKYYGLMRNMCFLSFQTDFQKIVLVYVLSLTHLGRWRKICCHFLYFFSDCITYVKKKSDFPN